MHLAQVFQFEQTDLIKQVKISGTGASVPADIQNFLFGDLILLSAGQLVPLI